MSVGANDASLSYRYLATENNNAYDFEYLERSEWDKRVANPKKGEISDLKSIAKIVTEKTQYKDLTESLNGRKLINAVKIGSKKHNSNPVQYLKWLLIPWIVGKIFGWTCMESYATPPSQKKFSLEHKDLSTWDDKIYLDSDLEELSLIDCNLKTLPNEIAGLKNLKKLVLENNQFESIPREIYQLENLEFLSLQQSAHGILDIKHEDGMHFCKLKRLKEVRFLNKSGLQPIIQAAPDHLKISVSS